MSQIINEQGQLLDGNYYGAIPLSASVLVTTGDAFFGEKKINTDKICISRISGFDGAPKRDISSFDIPRASGRGLASDHWRSRRLTLSGTLIASSWAELDQIIRDLKSSLAPSEQFLQYLWDEGETIKQVKCTWSATDSTFPERDHFNIGWLEFDLVFQTHENPYISEVEWDTMSLFNETRLVVSETINNKSTVRTATDPLRSDGTPNSLVFIVSSATDVNELVYHNKTSGRKIRVESEINSGDIIEIDSINEEVRINQEEVSFKGRFDEMPPGVNFFDISFLGEGATSIEYDFTFKYRAQYL